MATRALPNHRLSFRASSTRAAVLVTACCGVFFSFASVVVFTFGIFLKPLALAFHWSRTQVSFAFTLAALTVAVCSPFIGYLLDRFPARRVVIPCTIVYGAAFASLAFLTPHLWHLYATFVLIGVVGNGTTQLAYARVVSAWFDRHRGQALGAVMAGSGIGSMALPPIAQALISSYGWRVAYAVLGLLILLIAVPLASLFLDAPKETNPPIAASFPKRKASASVWSAAFLGIAAALLLFSFATNGLIAHWAALLTDGGSTPAQAAFTLSVAGAATLAGKLGTGYLLDRFRANHVAAALLALCELGFVFALHGYSRPVAVASAILVGIGMGAESDVVPYLLTRYFSLEQFGVLYGYTWCVYAVAGATGPVVMGAVFDYTGSYHAVLLVSTAMVIAASIIFGALPRCRRAALIIEKEASSGLLP